MRRHYKIERLENGETFTTKEKGNSMSPVINSNQEQVLAPISWEDAEIGDIVYCKVKGKLLTHFVKQKDPQKGCLIGNNKGVLNGWSLEKA